MEIMEIVYQNISEEYCVRADKYYGKVLSQLERRSLHVILLYLAVKDN
jgi:hypothetical protein